MSKLSHAKTLDIDYAKGREIKKALRYRLWRRTHEVLEAIDEFCEKPPRDIIDLGTADSRMLDMIHKKYPDTRCVGVEYNQELVDFGKANFPKLDISQGDIQSLDFPDNSFDVAIATAVIEHLPNPGKAMQEAKRVLRSGMGGILVLTAPDPFWERIATIVGHLNDDLHNEVMTLAQLTHLALKSGFVVLKTQKFMLSPVGMPFEIPIENIVRFIGFNFLFANQLMVCKKVKD